MYKQVTAERKQELLKYAPYVRIRHLSVGYARVDYDVAIRKDIPVHPTKQELISWCDDWNGCFGGTVSWRGSTNDSDLYNVRVYTD